MTILVHEYQDAFVIENDACEGIGVIPREFFRDIPGSVRGDKKTNVRAVHGFRDLKGLPRYTHIEARDAELARVKKERDKEKGNGDKR